MQKCEFGACGPGASKFSQGPGAVILGGAATIGCIALEPCGAIEGILAGVAVIGTAIGVEDSISQMPQHDRGNVADTGIEDEARTRFPNLDICSALRLLQQEAAGNSAKLQRIKKAQKAYGCRQSR